MQHPLYRRVAWHPLLAGLCEAWFVYSVLTRPATPLRVVSCMIVSLWFALSISDLVNTVFSTGCTPTTSIPTAVKEFRECSRGDWPREILVCAAQTSLPPLIEVNKYRGAVDPSPKTKLARHVFRLAIRFFSFQFSVS